MYLKPVRNYLMVGNKKIYLDEVEVKKEYVPHIEFQDFLEIIKNNPMFEDELLLRIDKDRKQVTFFEHNDFKETFGMDENYEDHNLNAEIYRFKSDGTFRDIITVEFYS